MGLSRGATRLLRLFRWCHYKCQVIDRELSWFSRILKCSLRAVKYWLNELRSGLVFVRRRARRTAVFKLSDAALSMKLFCTSSSPKVDPICTSSPLYNKKQEKPEETPRKPAAREVSVKTDHPLRDFERFFGMFLAAGKPLSRYDARMAEVQWSRIPDDQKAAAFDSAREQLIRTRDPHFMPLPANFLAARPWTRVAEPRTLPYLDPKTDKALQTHDEVIRLLKERGVA